MFSVLCAGVYGYFEKRYDSKVKITLCYFLAMGAIWTVFSFIMGFMMSAEDLLKGEMVNPNFFAIVPVAGFILGEIFAFFPWVTGLRKSGDDSREKS